MELKDYIRVIRKRLWLIILCVVVATISTAFYTSRYNPPIYQASTKIIVNKTVDMEQIGREQMDLSAMGSNIRLIETYKEIIRTPAITDKVVQRYPDLNLSANQLSSMINVQSVNNTQVMTLTATDFSYERATKIVNAVSAVFQTEIPKIMKVNNVAILHTADMVDNPRPINQNSKLYIMISSVISLFFAVFISFLLESLDDTLKQPSDIQKIYGVAPLAVITKLPATEIHAPAERHQQSNKQVGEGVYATLER